MPGINWNQLANIAPPQVVATLPQVPANNQLDSLAGGIMSGLGQASQLQTQKVQRDQIAQQMDQSKQLFPSQLQQSQQAAAAGQLELKDKADAQAYRIKVEKAADQGEAAYLSALRPSDAMAYKTAKANYENTVADVAKKSAENKVQQIKNGYLIQDSIGAANSAALQFQNPADQQKAYEQVRSTLPPDVQKVMSPQFDIKFAPIAVNVGTKAHAQYIETQFGASTATESTSPIQKTVDTIRSLKEAVSNAQTPQDKQKAQEDLDFALSQAKQDTSLWGKVKDKIADAVGSVVGAAVNSIPTSANSATNQITPEQAKAELARRGIK